MIKIAYISIIINLSSFTSAAFNDFVIGNENDLVKRSNSAALDDDVVDFYEAPEIDDQCSTIDTETYDNLDIDIEQLLSSHSMDQFGIIDKQRLLSDIEQLLSGHDVDNPRLIEALSQFVKNDHSSNMPTQLSLPDSCIDNGIQDGSTEMSSEQRYFYSAENCRNSIFN